MNGFSQKVSTWNLNLELQYWSQSEKISAGHYQIEK